MNGKLPPSIPEDPADRQAWLERWATEQQDRVDAAAPLRSRLERRTDGLLEGLLERLDPLLDRGLDTSRDEFFPTSGGAGLMYVAGPTPWHVLPRALRRIGAGEQDVFVELGCGKGRVVHQAARRPLRRVIGVELLPEVAQFAEQLVAARRQRYRCHDVEIVTADISRYEIPDDVTIAYYAYGFADEVRAAVLRNLIASLDRRPRRLRLIHHWPNQGLAQVLATGRFRLLPDASFARTAIFESCEPAAD